uniref:Uncharacterized protein n=1 Tax=Ditylenchus dipsaci TaxID=166011 RepID=A0A915D4F1_9BILA
MELRTAVAQLIEQIATCVAGKELGKQYCYRERRGWKNQCNPASGILRWCPTENCKHEPRFRVLGSYWGSVTSSLKSKEAADSNKEWREIGDCAQRLSRCFESLRKLPAVPFAYVQGNRE